MRFERRTGSFTASWSGFAAKRETEIELQTGGSARSGDVNYTACYAINSSWTDCNMDALTDNLYVNHFLHPLFFEYDHMKQILQHQYIHDI